jgi:small-conductance mechanosensitive channel
MANALEAMWTAFSGFAPRLLGAGLVLVFTLLVARLLQRVGIRALQRIGLDDLFETTGAASNLQRVGFGRRPSFVFGYVLFWGVLLAGVAAALSILGLASLQRNMDLMVALAGKAVVAVLILAGGLAAAGWLSNLAATRAEDAGLRGGDLFGRAIFAFVLALAVLVAAAQVGIEVSVLVLLAAILFGTVGIVAALALGLGLVPLSGNIAAGRYVQGNGIRPGDEISVNGIRGTVEELGLASVTLKSEDGQIHHIPNRILLDQVVSKTSPDDGQDRQASPRLQQASTLCRVIS